jgi:hypothetical protein
MKPKVAIPLALAGILAAASVSIANANGWFAGRPWLFYLCTGGAIMMIAIAIVGAVIDATRKPRSGADQPHSPINIHLENIGNPSQKQSNKQRLSTPLSQPVDRIQLPEVKPLPAHKARLCDFYNFASDTPMLLVPFRNDSVFGQALYFGAHIIYRDADLQEIADVERGTWFPLNRNSQRNNFQTGVTRKLAVLFFANNKPCKPILHWLREGTGRRAINVPEVWPKADEINKTISMIEVRLLSGDNEPLIFKFDLSEENGNPFPSLLWRN